MGLGTVGIAIVSGMCVPSGIEVWGSVQGSGESRVCMGHTQPALQHSQMEPPLPK